MFFIVVLMLLSLFSSGSFIQGVSLNHCNIFVQLEGKIVLIYINKVKPITKKHFYRCIVKYMIMLNWFYTFPQADFYLKKNLN